MSAGFSDFLETLGRPVAYYPSLAKVLGSIKAAVFLAQLMYWTPRGKKAEGWVFKTAEEWEAETGLTYEEQLGAKKILGEAGKNVIEIRYSRNEHTTYYRVKREVLDALWEASGKIPDAQKHQGKSLVASGKSLGGTRGKPSSVFHRLPIDYPETTKNPAPRNGAAKSAQAIQGLLPEEVAVAVDALEVPTPGSAAAPGAPDLAATVTPAPISPAAAPPGRRGHSAVVAYCDAWKVRYGRNPDISNKDAGILARLAKRADLEEYGHRLERYLRDDDPFLVKLAHPPSQFENRWNSLGLNGHSARPAGPALGLSRNGHESINEKWKDQPTGAVTL
jgi:hypothetical protein